ncbi:MAG: YfhO family protein [Thermoanaerobaculia bacterium]
MPWIDVRLVGMLAAAMLLLQALCWLLARGLGTRLERLAVLGGWITPILVLAPWLSGLQLLSPVDILQDNLPGAPAIAVSHKYDLQNDVLFQILPWELETRHAFAAGRLPFWSDALEGGSSVWSNPQAGVLSPLQIVARVFPIQHHLLAALALKLLVAFQGTWLLARFAGRSRPASLLAATAFSLGGGIFSWALFPVTATMAWVPWLAAGVIRLFRRPGARTIATTAVITGVLLLSGHPETAAFGGVFSAVCGLGLRRRKTGLVRGFGAAALAAVLGFGLAAPQLVPFVVTIPESQRSVDMLVEKPPYNAVTLRDARSWFAVGYAKFVLAPFSPHAYGRPYRDEFRGPINWADSEGSYAGLLMLAGAFVAMLAVRDRRAWPFLGFAAVALLCASRFLPLAHLLYAIPPLRVPAYARMLMPAALGLSVAAAFGIDHLLSRRRLRVWALVAIAVAAALSLWTAADPWTWMLWGLLAAAVAVARWRPRWGAVAMAAVLVLDLVPWARSTLPRGDTALFYPRTPFMELLVRRSGDPAVSRGIGGDYLIYPNLLPVYGVADFRPHNPLAPARYLRVLKAAFGFYPTMNQYFSPVRNLDHPLLDFLGVRAVAGSPAVPPSKTLRRFDRNRFPPFTLLRNPDALPRWFFPDAVDVIAPGDFEGWITRLTDARRVAVFSDEAGSWRPALRVEDAQPRPVLAEPGPVVLETPGAGERLLATSIVWSRGWRAYSRNRRLPVWIVNGAFVGVRIPEGTGRIELRFRPPGLVAGCAAFGVAGSIVLLLFVRRFSARSAKPEPPRHDRPHPAGPP